MALNYPALIYTLAIFACASVLRFCINLYKARTRMLQLKARGLVRATLRMII